MAEPTPAGLPAPPERRGARSFRIRTGMLLIAGLAVWLAALREGPLGTILLTVMAALVLGFYRGLARMTVTDDDGPPGLLIQAYLLVAALVFAVAVPPLLLLLVYLLLLCGYMLIQLIS